MLRHILINTNAAAPVALTNLRAKMEGVDVLPPSRRHLPLEVQSEVVGQEVTRRQSRAVVQSTLADVQADAQIREALQQLEHNNNLT